MWGITEKGYYWVKFYNHRRRRILYWTGEHFQGFPEDRADDEIEAVDADCIKDPASGE